MKGKKEKEMKNIRKLAIISMVIVIFMASAIFTGCTGTTDSSIESSKGSEIGSSSESVKLEEVTVVLDWIPNTNHVGLFAALEMGYFEEEGLDVRIVEAPEFNFIEMVGIDSAQFGICGQEQLSQARVSGNVPVVAIGTILQENTSGFASPSDRGILSPKDFEGKKYSGWGTPLEEKFIEALMLKDGGDFSKVEMRMMGATDFFASMETEADFAWIYYGWDGVGAEVIGYDLEFILLQDVDPELNFYSPILISNEKTIDENPEMARKFMRAVSKGYIYSVENPEDAADLLLIHTPETDREHVIKSIKYLSEFILDENGDFGTMSSAVWETFSNWMYENELLESPLDLDKSYTNEFLPID